MWGGKGLIKSIGGSPARRTRGRAESLNIRDILKEERKRKVVVDTFEGVEGVTLCKTWREGGGTDWTI